MPIRNMWSLTPGEVLTSEIIEGKIPSCQLYFPLQDKGIDLLIVKGSNQCPIQVKESRLYGKGDRPHSWHQVSETNINPLSKNKKVVPDLFVFLTYFPQYAENKLIKFYERYIIVPTEGLRETVEDKKASNGKFSFYFQFSKDEVWDIRESSVSYTQYLEKWGIPTDKLSTS
jgi:hypothetical protein